MVQSLSNLASTTNSVTGQISDISIIQGLNALSYVSGNVGSSFMAMGNSIIGTFQNIISNVQSTGSEFQALRITLNALLKDEQKAKTALKNLMNFAATTPFEITDLTGVFTTITVNGLDAFKQLTGATTGYSTTLLGAMGDLMSFRPDVPAARWSLAFTNAFSGEKKVLRNALDVDIESLLGRKWGSTAEQIAQDIMDLADAMGVAGLMSKNMGTLDQTLANVSDQFTRIYLAIADTGVFNILQTCIMNLASALNTISGEKLVKFANSVGSALQSILTPIEKLTQKIAKLIAVVADFIAENSKLAKAVVIFAGIFAVLLIGVGVILKITSTLSGLATFLYIMNESVIIFFKVFKAGFSSLVKAILPVILILGILYAVWNSDFAGIKTTTVKFAKSVINSFKNAKTNINGSVADMVKAIDRLKAQKNFESNLTLGLMKIMQLGKSLADGWSDYTLSEDNFLKAKELGILPLIEAILDLKYRFENFWKGFSDGWKDVGNRFREFVSGLAEKYDGTIFEKLIDGLTTVFQKLSSGDAQAWYDFGYSFAEFTGNAVALMIAFKAVDIIFGKVFRVISLIGGLIKIIKGVGKIGGAFIKLGKFIAKLFPNITKIAGMFSKIGGAVSKVFGVVGKLFNGIRLGAKGILTAIGVVVKAILGFFGIVVGLPAWVVGLITLAVVALVVLIIKYRDKIWSGLKWLGGKIRDGVIAILEFFKSIPSKIPAIVSAIIDFFKKIPERAGFILGYVLGLIVKMLWTIIKSIGKFAGFMLGKIGQILSWIGGKIGQFLSWLGGKLVEEGQALKKFFTETIPQKIKEGIEKIGKFFTETLPEFVRSIPDKLAEAGKKIQEFFTITIPEFFKDLPSKLRKLGGDIVNGLIKGITNGVSAIGTAISNFCSGFVKGFKKALGIHSPSKVFAEIGGFVIQGLINGMKNLITALGNVLTGIKDFMVSMFNNAWNAVKGVFSAVGEFFGGVFQLGIDAIQNVFGSIFDFFSGIWENVKALFSGDIGVVEFFTNIFTLAWDAITGVFGGLFDFFSGEQAYSVQ